MVLVDCPMAQDFQPVRVQAEACCSVFGIE
jgi:hypothetical protein